MQDNLEMRGALANALIEKARVDERIVVLDADLMSCHATKGFKAEFGDRFVNVGIAEQNMIGIAAGMTTMGKVPFAYSFGPFATRRCFDQIFVSCAYANRPVKIVGSDPGVTAEANGGTHMPFEDMAMMRAVPTMVCFEPTDATMLQKAIDEIVDVNAPVYIRMMRKKAEKVFDDTLDFHLGKAIKLREGKDVAIIASGIMVSRALEAAEILSEMGIDAKVVNMHTWKPLDEDMLAECCKLRAIVTCENHNIKGGLGSAVAEWTSQNSPIKIGMVGVNDVFGQVGKNAYLSEVFHLTTKDIVDKVLATLN